MTVKAECSIKIGLFKMQQIYFAQYKHIQKTTIVLKNYKEMVRILMSFSIPTIIRTSGFSHLITLSQLSTAFKFSCAEFWFGNHGNQSLTVNTIQSVHRTGAHISIYVHVSAAGSKVAESRKLV